MGNLSKYQYLLFDLDDNLMDFQASERYALSELLKVTGIGDTKEARDSYHRYNRAMWEALERGYISREYLFARRFAAFAKRKYDIDIDDVHELNEEYQEWLGSGHELMPQAKEVLEALKQKGYHMIVVTNGAAKAQNRRLKDSGLDQYFEKVFISEEVGYQKPQKEFFDYVFQNSDATPENSLVLGDSLSSDIQGANNAGIDSVWYNPSWKVNHTSARPTYAIKSWDRLLDFLENN
ncbi:HAD superfamily hydrolase [Ligilactobacillus hayakitensis DSM 18933 = JCM 14209]|uniref:HAD superfamily hydrolase n=1 Tax=Ligilactobacillus hayakitensis DSM 18933 = JCM 14209 TaxID=1423755 RepID=A0A0R1WNB4_9LACO|nr:HAD superfamily hydrolase [Ligilactobacillus hayakitensis DSM 18933 = JCM 14209]